MAHLREIGPIWLVWPSTSSTTGNTAQLAPSQGAQVVQRLEFYDIDPCSDLLADLRQRLLCDESLHGFDICPIDRNLLERCEWRSDMEFYCGSLDNFLANAMGLVMMQGNEIIAEAYASSFGETQAEIGAITRKAHRGHGYAPIACAYLIQALEQRGYRAYWSCDADNLASIRVARKLGFRQERAYQILEYE